MAGRRKGNVRHVKAGKHFDNAFDGFGCRGVDGLDVAMGNLRMLDPRIERAGRHPVFIILGSAGGLVKGVDTNLALAYDAHSLTSIFRSNGEIRTARIHLFPFYLK